MGISLVRVDSRLVHGQILEGWVPHLGVDRIWVVDRRLSGDGLQCRVLEGLQRPGLTIEVLTPEQAAAQTGRPDAGTVLVLGAGVAEAEDAYRAGLRFTHLNLGNVHPRPDSRPLTPSVYLSPADRAGLRRLQAFGVALEARAVPRDRSPDLAAVLAEDPA